MKTLLVALEYPPAVGGVENYYANLVRHWPAEIDAIDNNNGRLVNSALPFFRWLPAIITLAKTIRQYRPDWILAGEILPIGTAAWLLSHIFQFKYAVILHGLDFTLAMKSPRKQRLTRRILRRANAIICANSHTGALVQRFLPEASIEIINPGVEAEVPPVSPVFLAGLRANYDLEGKFSLLTVGRLVKRKGIDTVLEALAQLNRPDIRYVIIGRGPEEEAIKRRIIELKLGQQVVLLTDVDDEKKHAWLEACDAFIMPARDLDGDYEGFGIVYLEANLHGKPVIAGVSGGVSDAVIDGLTGLQVTETDPAAVGQGIARLADDPAYAKRLGEQGRERAKEFAWSGQIRKAYETLSQKHEK